MGYIGPRLYPQELSDARENGSDVTPELTVPFVVGATIVFVVNVYVFATILNPNRINDRFVDDGEGGHRLEHWYEKTWREAKSLRWWMIPVTTIGGGLVHTVWYNAVRILIEVT